MNDYVTERELSAHLGPMKTDIRDLKAGMETVVAYVNQQKGKDAKTRLLSDRRLAYGALIAGIIAPVGWLHIF